MSLYPQNANSPTAWKPPKTAEPTRSHVEYEHRPACECLGCLVASMTKETRAAHLERLEVMRNWFKKEK